MPDNAEIISDAHATMALGWLSAEIAADRRDDGLAPCPDPPEWLELWEEAIEETRAAAMRDMLEKARAVLDIHRSVDDVTGEHDRQPTAEERAVVEILAMAHYEAWGRVADISLTPWVDREPGRLGRDRAAMAELVRGGVVVPGPAVAGTRPDRLRELGVDDVARGAIEALVEALEREGCKLAEPDVMRRAVAAAMREVMGVEREINAEAGR